MKKSVTTIQANSIKNSKTEKKKINVSVYC